MTAWQAETQSRVGRLHADVQQIHHRELCQLYSIREELTQRQVLVNPPRLSQPGA